MEWPTLQATLENVVPALVIAQWQELASEHSDTGFYASHGTFERMFPLRGDQLAVGIANTAPYAAVLEFGRPAYHLPSVIDWSSPKVKVSAAGRRYLTIPFRHYTPGKTGVSTSRARMMMPRAVYRDAKRLLLEGRQHAEQRAEAALRLARAGERRHRVYDPTAPQPPHPHEDRTRHVLTELRARAIRATGTPGYTWRASRYEGMRAYRQTNPETGASHAQYFTFRTLAEDSLGWLIPAHPGYHLAERTSQLVAPEIRDLVAEAARADVVASVQAMLWGGA